MTANPTNVPRNEDPDHPAGPPVYSWDHEHRWFICLLCNNVATRDHILSQKHRRRYNNHLQFPGPLPLAQLPPRAVASGSEIPPPPPPVPLPSGSATPQPPLPSPPPPLPTSVDVLQDIQQSDQAVDELIGRLVVLLEQANGVLADIIRARSAERGDTTAAGPSQDDPAALRDDPTAPQDHPAAPQDDPTAERGAATTDGPPRDNPSAMRGDATADGPPTDDHRARGWDGGWWPEQHEYRRSQW